MPPRTAAAADPMEIETYGPVARLLHWLVAGLALIVVALGLLIPSAARETAFRVMLLTLHRSFGLTILAVMVIRIAWRLTHPPPPLPAGFPKSIALTAHLDHLLLYVLFVVMPLSGYINAAAAGHSVSFFGLATIPPLIAENERLSRAADALHLTAQFLIYVAVGAHVAGALLHHFVASHRIIERMLPGRRRARRGAATS
jgi:cytochrome b561